MFGNLFGNKKTAKSREPGEGVVSTAKLFAMEGFMDIGKRSTILSGIKSQTYLDDWDFFVTIAMSETVVSIISRRISNESTAEKIAFKIFDDLAKFKPDALEASKDFLKFRSNFLTNLNKQGSSSDEDEYMASGIWILTNVLKRQLASHEMKDAKLVGSYCHAVATNIFNSLCRE